MVECVNPDRVGPCPADCPIQQIARQRVASRAADDPVVGNLFDNTQGGQDAAKRDRARQALPNFQETEVQKEMRRVFKTRAKTGRGTGCKNS